MHSAHFPRPTATTANPGQPHRRYKESPRCQTRECARLPMHPSTCNATSTRTRPVRTPLHRCRCLERPLRLRPPRRDRDGCIIVRLLPRCRCLKNKKASVGRSWLRDEEDLRPGRPRALNGPASCDERLELAPAFTAPSLQARATLSFELTSERASFPPNTSPCLYTIYV